MRNFIKLSILLLVALSSLLIGCGSGSDSSDPGSQEAAITFHKNDGSSEQKTQTVELNVLTALEANTFTRTAGYTFLGWSSNPTATSPTYLDGANYTATTSSVNLYAVWTSVQVRAITFHKNDGSVERVTQYVPENTSSNLALNTFTRETHRFIGWSDTSNGGVIYLDGDVYLMGNSNVNLYAQWTVNNTYTITFDANGGSGVPPSVTATYGSPMPAITTVPTQAGHAFIGYFDAKTGGTMYYYSNLTSARNWDKADNATLYARWVIEIEGIAVGMRMVLIPAGTFQMGSPTTEPGRYYNETQHQVTLTTSFYMGKYQVTQDEYEAVMGTNPSYFPSNPASGEIQGKRPVECVSWYDALVFCNNLSMLEGLTPAYRINGSTDPAAWGTVPTISDATWDDVAIVPGSTGYRLPTEAQWEYSCRAGTPTAYHTGDTINTMTGWYRSNSNSRTHQVGLRTVNDFGLYDMHGNVYEWCWDWYDSSYYLSSPSSDPMGPVYGSSRVLRGGSWYYFEASYLRSACRDYSSDGPSARYEDMGFRVIRP
ncbi:MAG: SUMF1/EgtB/PvdO family nonheme iron enzyme [Leptospirales bacterium]|nr:SUMF1/EgtB/PvdO family nonheme iron enzyme [Leptospirales bacterium]